jgi:hypothetical protein
LIDASGSSLRVCRELRKGEWRVRATHTSGPKGKRVHAHGATSTHATEAEAKAAQEAIVQAAAKAGWTKRATGFGARPDAFGIGNLPRPTAAKR